MAAAWSGSAKLCALLLKHDAKPDAQDSEGMTALMFAARAGRADSVKALLAAGADPAIADYTGRDAASWADEARDPAVKAALAEKSR